MISRLAVGLVRSGAIRASPVGFTPGLYAARPRSFAWTRSLRESRESKPSSQDPASKAEAESSSKPESSSAESAKAESSSNPESTNAESSKPESNDAASSSENAKSSDSADAAPQSTPKPFNLPDLTQGIPSAFEYEASRSGSSLTAAPEEFGDRELPASAYISSTDRKRQNFAKWSFITALATMVGGVAYMGRNWEDEEQAMRNPQAPNGWNPVSWYKRAVARTQGLKTYFAEPAFDTLLPKVDPMLEKPYTLCISLEDMLVHSEWSREHGWRVAKRPGVDYFLRYLSQYYELVLFTTVPSAVALPVIQKLDPFQMIMFPLFREATVYADGEFVKVCCTLGRHFASASFFPCIVSSLVLTFSRLGSLLPEPRPLQGHHA